MSQRIATEQDFKACISFLTNYKLVNGVIAYYRSHISGADVALIATTVAEQSAFDSWEDFIKYCHDYINPNYYNPERQPSARSSASVLHFLYDMDTDFYNESPLYLDYALIVREAYEYILNRVS